MKFFVTAYLSISTVVLGGLDTAPLPPEPVWPSHPATDWLIDPTPFTADVYRTDRPDELVLANGLVRRVFRLAPNGATVRFDNLMTDESMLRAVKPEAALEIGDVQLTVGGLIGQPNLAFLRPEQLDALTVDPAACRLTGFSVDEPVERFPWKRVRHHAPDAVWPPKGVHLRMDYVLPELPPARLGAAAESATGRPLLLSDDFESMNPDWKRVESDTHERSSFMNEGKPGEIYTPVNTAVYAEKALPPGTRLAEATIHFGTDKSRGDVSLPPALAVVWPSKVVRFGIIPVGHRDNRQPLPVVWDGEQLHLIRNNHISLSVAWTFRIRLGESEIYCEARQEGGNGPLANQWNTYLTVPGGVAELGEPTAMRVGKMDPQGGPTDRNGAPGPMVRLKIQNVAAYGSLDAAAMESLQARRSELMGLQFSVHYELYDGVPVLSKWLSISNTLDTSVQIDGFTLETLAVPPHEERRQPPYLSPTCIEAETDFAVGSMHWNEAGARVVEWTADPEFETSLSAKNNPCLLQIHAPQYFAQTVDPRTEHHTIRAYELILDSQDRERRGLARRKMYRALSPWTTENPLMLHMVSARDPEVVKQSIDQAAEVGFEMVILSFGSGFNIESEDPAYLQTWADVATYAKTKGIEMGAYSLLASRNIAPETNIIPAPGRRVRFGSCPCLGSEWGQNYMTNLYRFYQDSGYTLFEHDGSYPGDPCRSTQHPGHTGLNDSLYNLWTTMSAFYTWCVGNGVYLNVPDYYFLMGQHKTVMGYRETNFTLPRAQQVIHSRQGMYDGTWEKTPSMGWMFAPLTSYGGGGEESIIEPLDEHLDHYERVVYSHLGMGVQACYRGPRLYDSDRTLAMITKWTQWFKQHRDILESDIIHGRRADGYDIDWVLHANPSLTEKGMLLVYNPLTHPVSETISVDLYYTGLTGEAAVHPSGGAGEPFTLSRDHRIELPVSVPAQGMAWYVIK